MKGLIDKLLEREDRKGRRYLVLEIGGERYSLWDEDMMDGLGEGRMIEYEWKQSGKYKNLTNVKAVPGYISSRSSEERDMDMIRMSCLKSAASLLAPSDLPPEKKGGLTLELAKQFERYIKKNRNE